MRATEPPPSPGHGSCSEVRASSLEPAEEVATPAPGFDPYTIVDNIADLTVEQLKESLLPEVEAEAAVKVDVDIQPPPSAPPTPRRKNKRISDQNVTADNVTAAAAPAPHGDNSAVGDKSQPSISQEESSSVPKPAQSPRRKDRPSPGRTEEDGVEESSSVPDLEPQSPRRKHRPKRTEDGVGAGDHGLARAVYVEGGAEAGHTGNHNLFIERMERAQKNKMKDSVLMKQEKLSEDKTMNHGSSIDHIELEKTIQEATQLVQRMEQAIKADSSQPEEPADNVTINTENNEKHREDRANSGQFNESNCQPPKILQEDLGGREKVEHAKMTLNKDSTEAKDKSVQNKTASNLQAQKTLKTVTFEDKTISKDIKPANVLNNKHELVPNKVEVGHKQEITKPPKKINRDKNTDNITEPTKYKPERKDYVAPVAPVLIRSSDKEEKKTVKSPEIFKEASHCDNSNGHLCKQMSDTGQRGKVVVSYLVLVMLMAAAGLLFLSGDITASSSVGLPDQLEYFKIKYWP